MITGPSLEALLGQAQGLLAERRFRDAQAAFALTREAAVAADDQATAALALLGRAQAKFQGFLLETAAEDAQAAFETLKSLRMSQAKRAADLIAQIDHHLRLR